MSKTELEIPAEGGEVTVEIKATSPWIIIVDKDWVAVSPLSGRKDTTTVVKFRASANETGETRTATVQVETEGAPTVTVSITQTSKPKEPEKPQAPTVSVAELEIPADGGEVTLEIQATSPWKITVDKDWVTVSPLAGEIGTSVVTLRADANETGETLTATIQVETEGASTVTITVSQDPVPDDPGDSSLEDPVDGGNWEW